ncbi:MAG TPA: sodium:solute symporter [Polyangia bacterium]|jgi:Na+/proline symporter|nr:sodium:solute symporter [Polyangia bacterium]
MTALDWVVLFGTLGAIVAYGVWKTRSTRDMASYLHGGYADRWPTIGLAVMATQASAITFLSTPGQAYSDGMRFLQFYFGLPLAMVVLSVAFVPRFYGLRVYTAYEYLEQRFDRKTRQLAAFLFLVQRGLSAGITIYAPAIVLSTVLGWSLNLTCIAIGALVILYTVTGGTRAVTQTQKHQMVVMLGGMAVAFVVVVARLPPGISFGRAVGLAGTLGKMNIVDFSLRLDNRYTFWSGITGGFFLAMSYFGTDQSQVQRYLSGRSITESRLGLLFNGLLKVPMQFLILFVGVMVFVFHQFQPTPIFFNPVALAAVRASPRAGELRALEQARQLTFAREQAAIAGLQVALDRGDQAGAGVAAAAVRGVAGEDRALRERARQLVVATLPRAERNDTDYIFISFVMKNLPRGLVGLLLAVILCAAMSSTASELTALGQTSVVDFYRRSLRPDASDAHYLRAAQLFTAGWGVLAVVFAALASLVDNLIQAVNILGSLFYGTILGLFLVAFFSKRVGAGAVFLAALLSEAAVIAVWLTTDIGFLWFNVVGCALVVAISWVIARFPAGTRALS